MIILAQNYIFSFLRETDSESEWSCYICSDSRENSINKLFTLLRDSLQCNNKKKVIDLETGD